MYFGAKWIGEGSTIYGEEWFAGCLCPAIGFGDLNASVIVCLGDLWW